MPTWQSFRSGSEQAYVEQHVMIFTVVSRLRKAIDWTKSRHLPQSTMKLMGRSEIP